MVESRITYIILLNIITYYIKDKKILKKKKFFYLISNNKRMQHNKLNNDLKKRLKEYMNYYWRKFKGIEENKLIQNLPPTLQSEIIL